MKNEHIIRITTSLSVVLVIIFSSIALKNITSQNRTLLQREKDKAIKLSNTILTLISDSMKNGNQENIQSEFEKYRNSKTVSEILLLDHAGQIKQSSEKNLLNQNLRLRNIIEDALQGSNFIGLEAGISGSKKVFTIVSSIPNQQECFGCHSQNIKILGVLKFSTDWTPVETAMRTVQQKNILISLAMLVVIMAMVIAYLKNFVQQRK